MADDQPIATLLQGVYAGKTIHHSNNPTPVSAWLGIPYAQPPLGDLRFARPQPLPSSNETFQATKFGYRCPGKQLLRVSNLPEPSEDCLTLNVFKQKDSGDALKLPVMLYMHGGAFNRGTAAMHDTASMVAHSSEPFLGISFNYRLGALGFLNCSLTEKEGLLNVGLHDQRMMMEWVQENAASFGGDGEDVTLVGLSAGAHSIAHHMMNVNEKRELFQKAVIESGAHTSRAVHPFDSKLHETQFQQFLKAVKCPEDKPEREILPFLRSLPSETIVSAQASVFDAHNTSVRWAWQPVIDNEVIYRRPFDAWKSGQYHRVPVMTGFNHNEGTMYVPKQLDSSDAFKDFFATLLPQLSPADLNTIDGLYPDPAKDHNSPYLETRPGFGAQHKRVEAAYGHYAYVAPVRQTAQLASEVQDEPVYLYHWALRSSVENGANHGDQMWYETMDAATTAISPEHRKIARYFHDYICSFVVSGDPNAVGRDVSGKRPVWRGFGACGETMVFGEGNEERTGGKELGVAAAFKRDQWAERESAFWWRISEHPED